MVSSQRIVLLKWNSLPGALRAHKLFVRNCTSCAELYGAMQRPQFNALAVCGDLLTQGQSLQFIDRDAAETKMLASALRVGQLLEQTGPLLHARGSLEETWLEKVFFELHDVLLDALRAHVSLLSTISSAPLSDVSGRVRLKCSEISALSRRCIEESSSKFERKVRYSAHLDFALEGAADHRERVKLWRGILKDLESEIDDEKLDEDSCLCFTVLKYLAQSLQQRVGRVRTDIAYLYDSAKRTKGFSATDTSSAVEMLGTALIKCSRKDEALDHIAARWRAPNSNWSNNQLTFR